MYNYGCTLSGIATLFIFEKPALDVQNQHPNVGANSVCVGDLPECYPGCHIYVDLMYY